MSNPEKYDEIQARENQRTALALMWLSQVMDEGTNTGMYIKSVTVKGPELTGSDYQAIVKGRDDSGNVFVGFRNGADVGSLMRSVKDSIQNGTIKWREDRPYDPQTQK